MQFTYLCLCQAYYDSVAKILIGLEIQNISQEGQRCNLHALATI